MRFTDTASVRWSDLELPPDAQPPDQPRRSAWDWPLIADHPERPPVDAIRLTPDRLAHITDGDASGGGHLAGTERPGKAEFPAHWDDDQVGRAVSEVARFPQRAAQQPHGRWLVEGAFDGVRIHAAVNPDGRIWSAWPVGGPGVTTNPD
jgi:hypothetical protein